MVKFYKDFKILIFVFIIFFVSAYSAIRLDQAMGWEKQRSEKNLNRIAK